VTTSGVISASAATAKRFVKAGSISGMGRAHVPFAGGVVTRASANDAPAEAAAPARTPRHEAEAQGERLGSVVRGPNPATGKVISGDRDFEKK
jgi:hypothetical protein